MPPTVVVKGCKRRQGWPWTTYSSVCYMKCIKTSKKFIECVFICAFLQTLMNVFCKPITVVWALCVRTKLAPSYVTPSPSASLASHRTPMATVLVRIFGPVLGKQKSQCVSKLLNKTKYNPIRV